MTPASQRPLLQRLWMACVALLFLLQPLAGAAVSCPLRAKLLGAPCCCAQAPRMSCCSKRTQHDAPAQKRAPKHCGCELSAPPPPPPGGALQLPALLGDLARALDLPLAPCRSPELAHAPVRAHAPPGFATCFHARLDAGIARALAFERTLRC